MAGAHFVLVTDQAPIPSPLSYRPSQSPRHAPEDFPELEEKRQLTQVIPMSINTPRRLPQTCGKISLIFMVLFLIIPFVATGETKRDCVIEQKMMI